MAALRKEKPVEGAHIMMFGSPEKLREDELIEKALGIIEGRMTKPLSDPLDQPELVAKYFRLKLRGEITESMWAVALDARNRAVKFVKLSEGTTNSSCVYPRELVRAILDTTAVSVIIVHNHPSGKPVPSACDRTITKSIKDALALFDINLLDHLIIADEIFSFLKEGLL